MDAQDNERRKINIERKRVDLEERKHGFERTMRPMELGIKSIDTALKGPKAIRNSPDLYNKAKTSHIAGNLNFEQNTTNAQELDNGAFLAQSSVQVVGWMPSCGFTDGNSKTTTTGVGELNAATRALQEVQETVRKENAGSAKNYEPSDIGLIVFDVDSIITQYFELARAVGIVNHRDVLSTRDKEDLCHVLFNEPFNQVVNELPDIVFGLNAVRDDLAGIPIPNFSLFVRHAYLASNILKDSDSDRSRFIVYACEGRGKMYSVLQLPRHFGYSNMFGMSVALRLQGLRETIDNLRNLQSYVTIMGDIHKAYPETLELPEITQDYALSVIHDEDLNEQLDNTLLVGTPIWRDRYTSAGGTAVYQPGHYDIVDLAGNITQGCIKGVAPGQTDVMAVLKPIFWKYAAFKEYPLVVDSPVNNPSSDLILELTRNMVDVGAANEWGSTWKIDDETYAGTNNAISYVDLGDQSDDLAALPAYASYNSTPANFTGFQTITLCGTEIFTRAIFFTRLGDNTPNGPQTPWYNEERLCPYNKTSSSSLPKLGVVELTYVHKPTIEYDEAVNGIHFVIGDYYNAIGISRIDLGRLHYTAVFSEFLAGKVGGKGGHFNTAK